MVRTIRRGVANWKTTLGGVLAFLAIAAPEISKLLDDDAATNPNWELVVPAFIAMVTAVYMRDADKSSEDSGVK